MAKKPAASATSIQLTSLLADFRLLLILFLAFRVMLLMIYQPLLASGIERGITVGGDYLNYYQMASLSNTAGLPFRDWWSEFPPVWSYLSVLLYQLSGGARGNYTTFAMFTGLLMLAFDAGNLVLIR